MNLGRAAARGAASTLVAQAVRIIIQVGSVAVLARILRPEDFGLLAMVLAVLGVAELLRDFGLSQAAVQARHLGRLEQNNLFWLNVLLGFVAAAAFAASAPLVARFYGEPELHAIMLWLSLIFVLNGFATQFRVVLTRRLAFGTLGSADVIAQFVGSAAGIAVALCGGGYWALVTQQCVIATVGLLVAVVTSRWRPGHPSRHTSVRSFVRYGTDVLGVQALNYLSNSVDTVALGSRFGSTTVGFYSQAMQLVRVPLMQLNAPASRVALPVLSRLQDDGRRFNAYLNEAQNALTLAAGSVFVVLWLVAEPLVALALGPQWGEAVPFFRVLCIAGLAQSLSYSAYWIYMAKGLTRQNLRFALATKPVLIVGVVLAALHSPLAVAWVYSLLRLALWPASLWWAARAGGLHVRQLLTTSSTALVATSAAGLLATLALRAVPALPDAVLILAALALYLVFLILIFALWPRFRRSVHMLTRMARRLR